MGTKESRAGGGKERKKERGGTEKGRQSGYGKSLGGQQTSLQGCCVGTKEGTVTSGMLRTGDRM